MELFFVLGGSRKSTVAVIIGLATRRTLYRFVAPFFIMFLTVYLSIYNVHVLCKGMGIYLDRLTCARIQSTVFIVGAFHFLFCWVLKCVCFFCFVLCFLFTKGDLGVARIGFKGSEGGK